MTQLNITIDGVPFRVELGAQAGADGGFLVTVEGARREVRLAPPEEPGGPALALVDGRPYELQIDPALGWLRSARGTHAVEVRDPAPAAPRPRSADGRIKAPIPGTVVRVLVEPGRPVAAGQPVLVLEAMKMQNEIRAPRAGVLSDLRVRPGQSVGLHELMGEVE